MKLMNFRVEDEMAEWLKDYAERQNTYISEVIRYAISQLKIQAERPEREGKSKNSERSFH